VVEETVAELSSAGFLVHSTQDVEEFRERSAGWHSAGELRAVVACGGDGTASLVRNLVPLDVPMIAVPMGTENLLGRYLSQLATPAAVRQTIEHGVTIGLDLGLVRPCGPAAGSGTLAHKYFLMMISAGFDAEVVRRLHDRRCGHVTRRSYLKPALDTMRSYSYPELRLYCDEDRLGSAAPIGCRWAFAFNLPLYACGWQIAPEAVGTDALLDVCAFQRGSLLQTARYLWHVTRGKHLELRDTQHIRSRRFRLEATNGMEVAYQLDGDSGGDLPIEVDLLPGELRLLVMPDVASRLGFSIDAPPKERRERATT
jgi:diacylglycerol kinase family enzyme